MPGYRVLHRETNITKAPLWQLQALDETHILSGAGDGLLRIHSVVDKELSESNELDASALSLELSCVLVGPKNQVVPPPNSGSEDGPPGISQVSVVRNYVGDDENAGDFVVASLDFTGRVRVWTFPMEAVEKNKELKSQFEFVVDLATGTQLALEKPRTDGPVRLAIAMLDGTVQIVSTGLATQKAKKEAPEAGSLLDTLGSPESPIVMSLIWHPVDEALVVGRKHGVVELLTLGDHKKSHRISFHYRPVRALSMSNDAALLLTGADDGHLAVWDMCRNTPTMVNHVVDAHASTLVLGAVSLADTRRFVTVGANHSIHVWLISQWYAPVHTFEGSGEMIVSIAPLSKDRLVSGGRDGSLVVYSVE